MRVRISKSYDFNQMLVASVFAHLLFMTFVLFLPKSSHQERVIKPAFMVELVEITQGKKAAAQKPARIEKRQKTAEPEVKKTEAAKPQPKAEPVPLEKLSAAKPDPTDQILKNLDLLEKKPPAGLVAELDQLAKLAPQAAEKKPQEKKTEPILEKPFDELNALKNKQAEQKRNIVPPPQEDPLAQFDRLKMQEDLAAKLDLPKPEEVEAKNESRLQELEFAPLSRNTVELEKKTSDKSAAELLRELASLETPAAAKSSVSQAQPAEFQPSVSGSPESFDPILRKLDSLKVESRDIKADTVNPEAFAQKFESDIRNVSTPQRVHVEVVTSPNEAHVQSAREGDPGADLLSQYIGMIHEKVYKNWREPLGGKYSKEVIASFYIYRKGNIDRPSLKQSSGVEMLDSLAIRAIMESEPFPEFPEGLNNSNLNVTINFKYIPEKN